VRGIWSFFEVGPLEDVRLELAANIQDFEPADLGRCGEPYTPLVVCDKTFGLMAHGLVGVAAAGEIRPEDAWESSEGFEVGCHSFAHDYRLTERVGGEIARDLRRAKKVFEDELGMQPLGFRAREGAVVREEPHPAPVQRRVDPQGHAHRLAHGACGVHRPQRHAPARLAHTERLGDARDKLVQGDIPIPADTEDLSDRFVPRPRQQEGAHKVFDIHRVEERGAACILHSHRYASSHGDAIDALLIATYDATEVHCLARTINGALRIEIHPIRGGPVGFVQLVHSRVGHHALVGGHDVE